MINAKEAWNATITTRLKKITQARQYLEQSMMEIEKLIKSACESGESGCNSMDFLDRVLFDLVGEELEKIGFEISDESKSEDDSPFLYYIGWSNQK